MDSIQCLKATLINGQKTCIALLQTKDKDKRAQACIKILFEPKKTELYGSFIHCEYGTRMNFENMSNFAIPLVILTWHQMLQEYFWKNSNKLFFHFGHYSAKTKGIQNICSITYI